MYFSLFSSFVGMKTLCPQMILSFPVFIFEYEIYSVHTSYNPFLNINGKKVLFLKVIVCITVLNWCIG